MKNANTEVQQLATSWISLREQHPGELDFGPAGYPGLTAIHFDDLFKSWAQSLNLAMQKTKAAFTAEEYVTEAALMKPLRDMRGHIYTFSRNGDGTTLFQEFPRLLH